MSRITMTVLSVLILISACTSGSKTGTNRQLPVYLDESKTIDERVEDIIPRLTLEEKVALCHAQSKFSSPGVQRLGIPELWMNDGPFGVRSEVLYNSWTKAETTNDSCTAFPALTVLASSWNMELASQYGQALSEEANYREKAMQGGRGHFVRYRAIPWDARYGFGAPQRNDAGRKPALQLWHAGTGRLPQGAARDEAGGKIQAAHHHIY